MLMWLLTTTHEPAPMRCVNRQHEDKYMVSSRKLSRREFCTNFPLLISAALTSSCPQSLPCRKFNIGDRVISERVCDDDRSPNYGGIDWEKGYVIGYCWSYDEWLCSELQQGWTYFVRYYATNNSSAYLESWIDFEHESRLRMIC